MIDGKPLLLEWFCGTKSIGKEFEKVGFKVVSLDFDPQFNPDICADILTLDPNDFRGLGVDVFWASPPCNAFSVAVIGKNWHHDHTPKNDTARLGLKILEKTVEFVRVLLDDNPDLQFWFENPRGKMRRMPIVQDFKRNTVSYCQYGDTRMKPTDIWTNTDWVPRPMCKSGDGCHEAAPRGSKTGTQGIKGSRDRAIIPAELCAEIASHAKTNLK
jgi:hypothetical protein